MASFESISVSPEDFKLFHAIDRELYSLLVTEFLRDPMECLQTMALWLWMERAGHKGLVKKILSLPYVLINELADEALVCLKCISDTPFQHSSEPREIPLTQCLSKKEISLQFFHENRLNAKREVMGIVTDVCLRAFADILQEAVQRNAAHSLATSQNTMMSPAVDQSLIYGFAQLGLRPGICLGRMQVNAVPPDDRTMFVTFSRGYPVSGVEIRDFFNGIFGNCVESIHMQVVKPDEQPLYARIVFHMPSIMPVILNGVTTAKFTINGKHVWMRKFVPKRLRSPLPLLLPESLPGSV